MPSGDELVPIGTAPRDGQIVETNSLMLAAMVEEAGGVATRAAIVADDPGLLAQALAAAAAQADLVLLLSGSAGGAGDHAVAVMERLGHVVARGVAVKPGHPVVLAHCGPVPVIGVPGYPVSAALAFELFGVPLLAELSGRMVTPRPRVRATAAVALRSTPASDEWMRLRLARLGTALVATPLRRGAGVLSSLARADGLTCVPIGSALVDEGEEIEVELLRPLADVERSLVVSGSTDPLLDELAARFELLADCDGSTNGAVSLVAGHCHLALVPLEDVPHSAAVISTWERTLGLVVAPGDPLAIGGIEGLRRREVRLVNRQQGSDIQAAAGRTPRRTLHRPACRHGLPPRGTLPRRRRGGRRRRGRRLRGGLALRLLRSAGRYPAGDADTRARSSSRPRGRCPLDRAASGPRQRLTALSCSGVGENGTFGSAAKADLNVGIRRGRTDRGS